MIGVVASSFVRSGAVTASPPTRVAWTKPSGYSVTATSQTSPGLSVSSGDMLAVIGYGGGDTQTMTQPTLGVASDRDIYADNYISTSTSFNGDAYTDEYTGSPVTWTLRQSVLVTGWPTLYLWTGVVNTPNGNATVSVNCASQTQPWTFTVTQWRNFGGINTSKWNGDGVASIQLTANNSRSAMQFGASDWNAVAAGSPRSWLSVNGAPMIEDAYANISSWYTVYGGYSPNVGTVGTKSLGLSGPVGQKYASVGLEVLPK